MRDMSEVRRNWTALNNVDTLAPYGFWDNSGQVYILYPAPGAKILSVVASPNQVGYAAVLTPNGQSYQAQFTTAAGGTGSYGGYVFVEWAQVN